LEQFDPVELPESVAKELLRDLLGQANNPNSDDMLNAAEASYQLAIAYFEGIGTTKDITKSLEWLQKAAVQGSSKALAATANIFESLAKPIPQNLEEIQLQIREHAQEELLESLFHTITNTHSAREQFPSLRYWATRDPTACRQHLQLPFLKELQATLLSTVLCLEDRQITYEPFDFQVLEGLNLHGDPQFNNSKRNSFVESVRQAECIESIGHSRLTLLQVAALIGEARMAEALVRDLGANVNAVGDTPGYSPLWISCLNGHLGVALFLVQHGADVTVRDTEHGRTVLHFLNRFTSKNDISKLLKIGLRAGLSVDELDLRGNTPLLSTFIGWDFSDGAAAEALLEANANPVARSKSNFSAMAGTIRSLEVEGLLLSFKHAARYQLDDGTGGEHTFNALQQARALAYNMLCCSNEFYFRRICGKSVGDRLSTIIGVVLEDDLTSVVESMGLGNSGNTPLIIASYRRRNDLLSAMLNCKKHQNLDAVDSYGMTALHWCAERANVDSAKRLLRCGANPLIYDAKGLNIFHVAARFAPEFLDQILVAFELGEAPYPPGLDAMALVTAVTENEDKATPFVLAVMEGTPTHLKCAENLRSRYHLDHDAYEIPALDLFVDSNIEAKMTLTAYLVGGAVMTNITALEQVEYLLSLEPKPKFKADTSGKTLLHYAVSGYYHGEWRHCPISFSEPQLLITCSKYGEQSVWLCCSAASSADIPKSITYRVVRRGWQYIRPFCCRGLQCHRP
jgi:ankyrin repeat protein